MEKEQAHVRFKQAFKYLRDKGKLHNQQELVPILEIGKSHVSEFVNGKERYFTELNLTRFADAFRDYIDKDWLLTGVGEMAVPDERLHPYLEAKAAAGFLGGGSIPEKGDHLRDLDSFFPRFNYLIRAYGRSMEPLINDEDVLICQKLTDTFNPPIGKICVIDTDDAAIVKEIAEVRDGHVYLHSINPEYPDLKIEFSSINGVALVVGSLRPNL